MSEKNKGRSNLVSIVTAVLSLVSALGVALIGYQVNRDKLAMDEARLAMEAADLEAQARLNQIYANIEQETLALEQSRLGLEQSDREIKAKLDQIYADIEKETLSLEQRRFEAEQRSRRDGIMKEYVPKLLSEDGRQEAVAVLFVIYPNDASNILAQVTEALGEEEAKDLEPLVAQAQTLDEKTGEWAVVIGADSKLEDPGALHEVDVAKEQGYEAAIYLKNEWYVTTIGPFPTQVDAERAQIIVRTEFPGGSYRQGAYIVNLNQWCPEPVKRQDFVECQTP